MKSLTLCRPKTKISFCYLEIVLKISTTLPVAANNVHLRF